MKIEILKFYEQYELKVKLETAKEMHLFNNMFIIDDTVEYGTSPYKKFIDDNDMRCSKPYYDTTNNDCVIVFIVFPMLCYIESVFNTNKKDISKVKKFVEKQLKNK
jgi:hypothetical protein